MTRDFNNQRQDDRRPSSRPASSNNHRDEQPSHSPRPRLSRDAVDRAWENGANRTYADYRPRQNPNSTPNQRQGRPSSGYERSQPAQNRRPYDQTRQSNYRGSNPTSPTGGYQRERPAPPANGYQRERPASPTDGYQRERPTNGYQREYPAPYDNGQRRFNEPGQRAPGAQSGLNSQRWTRDQQNSAPQERNRPGQYQEERTPRYQAGGPNAAPRNNYRAENGPRSFERNNRNTGNYPRGGRPGGPDSGGQRDTHNPRWQSRPTVQRTYRENTYEQPGTEQFEGDYERFDNHDNRPRVERSQHSYEQPVTRMPDGRVLKGPGSAQRQQARFWDGVAEETNKLTAHTPATSEQTEPAQETTRQARPARPAKPATSKPRIVKTMQVRPTPQMKSKHSPKINKKKNQPHSTQGPVIRPSQRGYQWPTGEE